MQLSHSTVYHFADDTNLLYSDKTVKKLLVHNTIIWIKYFLIKKY